MSESAEVRNAATVVVVRDAPDGDASRVRLFMVRRSGKTAFMPHTWVFPGGRVDPEDGYPGSDESFDRAARRECAEEAGLTLEGTLEWFDTWKTPSAESKRRYLARFYVAHVDDEAHAEAASHDGEESVDGRWGTAQEFLAEWDAGECDLPPPTLAILGRVAAGALPSMMARANADLVEPILPRIGQHEGAVAVVLPHDTQYDQGFGEAGPCPSRVRDYPPRFARLDDRWVPISDSPAPDSPGPNPT